MAYLSHPDFPNSIAEPFHITSSFTQIYNCIAWAFGDNTKWYWPDPSHIYYWPPGINRTIELDAFIELYALIGYEVCENGDLVEGVEKIAVFTNNDGIPTHAARQLTNGQWTSKLGQNVDVSHSISGIEGGAYGQAAQFMQRVSEVQTENHDEP